VITTPLSSSSVNVLQSLILIQTQSSTNLCSMVLKETVAYYVQNQNSVFCSLLDSSEAFDIIIYCKLFMLLVKCELTI